MFSVPPINNQRTVTRYSTHSLITLGVPALLQAPALDLMGTRLEKTPPLVG
ncbi:hypothetical protein TcasGA2_TC007605 [Tribolium castaneum]|uniref:Uncharacterized protein n=1 Tax=Tribolium castaneum TaxID=7070 RepID=D2A2Y1_TRICA|nr:hypothetical protein TcasGA2_TC007605 [Tribolium castaneum]